MKVIRLVVVAMAIAAFAILAHTQTRPAPGAAAPPQTRPAAAAPAGIAVIDSAAFTDEKQGIARAMTVMRGLEAKFLPLRNELKGMREKLNTMRADLQKKQAIQDAKITQQQADEADRLEVQIKRKAEDAQASYQKESLAVLEPLQKDIGEALNTYAQQKGISLLIDVNRVPVIYAASSLDVTRDFIAEYNRTHPATGAAPAPARP